MYCDLWPIGGKAYNLYTVTSYIATISTNFESNGLVYLLESSVDFDYLFDEAMQYAWF